MTHDKEPSGAAKMFGDFAPALVEFTDDVLFGQVWARKELSAKDRSLVTVASLVTGSRAGHPRGGVGDVAPGRDRADHRRTQPRAAGRLAGDYR